MRRGSAVNFGTGDMTFFNTQRPEVIKSVWDNVKRLPGGKEGVPDLRPIAGTAINYVGKLPREGQAADHDRHIGDFAVNDTH